MAKRSHKRPVRYEKDQSGCMWGLISIFDFRHGRSTRRLPSNRRRGNGRHHAGLGHPSNKLNLLTNSDDDCGGMDVGHGNFSDGDESKNSKTIKVDSGKTSVKTLMDEEMSKMQHSKKQMSSAASAQLSSDLEPRGHFPTNHKQTSKTCKVACDLHFHDKNVGASASLEPHPPCRTNLTERLSNNTDLATMVEELCSQDHQFQAMRQDYKNGTESRHAYRSISGTKHNHLDELDMQLVQKSELGEVTEAFLTQKFIDAKQHARDGSLYHSKEFMDALEILDSNKELFLKLLQNPNSLLGKHIQDLRSAQAYKPAKIESCKSTSGADLSEEEIDSSRHCKELVSHKQFQKPNMQKNFRKKDKLQGRDMSKGGGSSRASSSRIVVLKPDPSSIQTTNAVTGSGSLKQSHYELRNLEESEKVTSHFSLREFRKKFQHAIGESKKDRHWISMDSILHKIPFGNRNSGVNIERDLASKNLCHSERMSKTSGNSKMKDKRGKPKESQSGRPSFDNHTSSNTKNVYPQQRENTIYKEAKKHLAEMLNVGEEDEDMPTGQVPKTLGRILSAPEYNFLSPRLSPGRGKEHSFSPEWMRSFPYDNFWFGSEKIWRLKQENISNNLSPFSQNRSSLCNENYNQDGQLQEPDPNRELLKELLLPDNKIQEETIHIRANLSAKDDRGFVEIIDDGCMEKSYLLDVLIETECHTPITNKDDDVTEQFWKEESRECLILGPSEEKLPETSSLNSLLPSPLLVHKIEAPESFNEKPERPSPVSVLESLFVDDVISPASSVPQHEELSVQPRRIHFEEPDDSVLTTTTLDPVINRRNHRGDKVSEFEYVRTVLEASGLSYDEFFESWHTSDQPLNPSLFNEIEDFIGQSPEDRKYLFDCINEVLVEVNERFYSCSPWVSFAQPTIRPFLARRNMVGEVWEGINWHHPQSTLDQIVGKDMAKPGSWIDLRFDTEIVGIQMGEVILEELMEETVLELWN